MTATLLVLLAASAASIAAAQPPGIEPTERRELAPGESLGAAIASVDDAWVAWAAPLDRPRDLCCWTGGWRGPARRRGCSLSETSEAFVTGEEDPAVPLPTGRPSLAVLVERHDGAATDLRIVSGDCPLRRDGEPLTWIAAVPPEESLGFLEGLVRSDGRDRVREGALTALALHGVPRATDVLADLARTASRAELRGNAVFWLGEARGEAGYRVLDRMLTSGREDGLAEKIVFALSVSDAPAAHQRLLELAGSGASARIRSEALFWLAQDGGPEVEDMLWRAAERSAERSVREKAVFAMSQLPGERAVDALLHALRETRRPDVRRQALFWLAESDDPRALDEIERLLGR